MCVCVCESRSRPNLPKDIRRESFLLVLLLIVIYHNKRGEGEISEKREEWKPEDISRQVDEQNN